MTSTNSPKAKDDIDPELIARVGGVAFALTGVMWAVLISIAVLTTVSPTVDSWFERIDTNSVQDYRGLFVAYVGFALFTVWLGFVSIHNRSARIAVVLLSLLFLTVQMTQAGEYWELLVPSAGCAIALICGGASLLMDRADPQRPTRRQSTFR